MPKEQEQFQQAVVSILEAVMFENWLRFYFIAEKADADDVDGEHTLYLAVPDKAMTRIREEYAHLLPLAEELNGKTTSFENSQQAVCNFVVQHLDGKAMPRQMADMVFDSSSFQTRMQLFNAWVQMHEAQLEQTFMDFGQWRSLFAQWCETDKVKDLATRLAAAAMHPVATPAPESTH